MRRTAVVTVMAGSALAGLILGGVGIADAQDSRRSSDDPVAANADTKISRAQAEAIAILAVGGGSVQKTELELEDEGPQWQVDVIKGGTEFDVRVDATTGAVLRLRTDDGNLEQADDDGVNDDAGEIDDRGRDGVDDRVDDHGVDPVDDHADDRGRDDHSSDDRSGSGDGSGGHDNSGPGSGSSGSGS